MQSFAYSHLACEFSDESPEPIGQLVYRPVSRLHRPSWDTCYPALQDWLHARSYGTAEEGRSLARVERALLRSLDPLCSSAVHHSSMRGVRSRSLRFHVIKVMTVTEDFFLTQCQPQPIKDSAFVRSSLRSKSPIGVRGGLASKTRGGASLVTNHYLHFSLIYTPLKLYSTTQGRAVA